MPGLVGYTNRHLKYDTSMLLTMRKFLNNFDWYIDEDVYSEKTLCASGTHLDIDGPEVKQFYYRVSGLASWTYGEFYNLHELQLKYGVPYSSDRSFLADCYAAKGSFAFLKDIDGCYSAVLYDKDTNRVHLITDRYGFKPLYWSVVKENLIWSSELKVFLAHKDFIPVIDPQAVDEFFGIGYLLENRSWFNGVELVPPASVITFDIENAKIHHEQYWHWEDITSLETSVDEEEVIDELGRLFVQAVRKRVKGEKQIGVFLSGGLDSRAVLAAIPTRDEIHSFTFGIRGCDDVIIADNVANTKGSIHHFEPLNVQNWLMPRIFLVWRLDGLLNLMHMHGLEICSKCRLFSDVFLNGFLGDAILGGSYIVENESVENRVRNRGRRLINHAIVGSESWIVQRRPFFDNDFFEFVTAIPENLRKNSYIYKKMLIKLFPEFYRNIPWQKTGYPIAYSKRRAELVKTKRRWIDRFKYASRRLGYSFREKKNFADYEEWIRREPAKSVFEKILGTHAALHPNYVDPMEVNRWLNDHMVGRANHTNRLCKALTFELWLRQIFEGQFRRPITSIRQLLDENERPPVEL